MRTGFEVEQLPTSGTHGRQFNFIERWEDGSATVIRIREDGMHYVAELPENGVRPVNSNEDFDVLLANANAGTLIIED